jgi:hypothetical protein
MAAHPVPDTIADVNSAWLREALGFSDVECRKIEPLGSGHMADTHVLTLSNAPWPKLVIKTAAMDDKSRATARRHRSYEVEAGFYRDLATTLGVRLPQCHLAEYDPTTGAYALLLEFVENAEQGDQVVGCTADQANAALKELTLLHGGCWGRPTLRELPWLNRHGGLYRETNAERIRKAAPQFVARYSHRLSPEIVELVSRLAYDVDGYDRRGQDGPPTVGHGDFRADNLLFERSGAWILDWQTAFIGNALVDVSYFLGGSLTVQDRRTGEQELVRDYYARLVAAGGHLDWNECWRNYRRYAFEGLITAIISAPEVRQGERGDDLFVTMTERAGWHALDLDAASLLHDGERRRHFSTSNRAASRDPGLTSTTSPQGT